MMANYLGNPALLNNLLTMLRKLPLSYFENDVEKLQAIIEQIRQLMVEKSNSLDSATASNSRGLNILRRTRKGGPVNI
jgi:hypothetical protein